MGELKGEKGYNNIDKYYTNRLMAMKRITERQAMMDKSTLGLMRQMIYFLSLQHPPLSETTG